MKKAPTIGRSESDVLRFIAEQGDASVTEVGEYLASTKGQTRNTALNMMERLRAKGFIARKKVEGVYRYAPSQEKGTLLQQFVEDFVEGVLGGATAPLVAYLGKRAVVEESELEELRKLVKSLEGARREP